MQDDWKKIKEKLEQESLDGPRPEDWSALQDQLPLPRKRIWSTYGWLIIFSGLVGVVALFWLILPLSSPSPSEKLDAPGSTSTAVEKHRESEKKPTGTASEATRETEVAKQPPMPSDKKQATSGAGETTAQSAADSHKVLEQPAVIHEPAAALHNKPLEAPSRAVLEIREPTKAVARNNALVKQTPLNEVPRPVLDEVNEIEEAVESTQRPRQDRERPSESLVEDESIQKESEEKLSQDASDRGQDMPPEVEEGGIADQGARASAAEEQVLSAQSPFKLEAVSWASNYHYRSGAEHWWSSGLQLNLALDRWLLEVGVQYGQLYSPQERTVNLGRQWRIDSTLSQEIEQRQEQRTRTYWVVDSFFAGHWQTDTFTVQVSDTTYRLHVDTITVSTEQKATRYLVQDYQELPLVFGYRWQKNRWSLALKGGVVLNRATYLLSGEQGQTGSAYGLFTVFRPEVQYRLSPHWSLGLGPQWRAVLKQNAAFLGGAQPQWGAQFELRYHF